MSDETVVLSSKNQLSYAQARELLSGDIEGQRLPLIELIERQAVEIERLKLILSGAAPQGWIDAMQARWDAGERLVHESSVNPTHQHAPNCHKLRGGQCNCSAVPL